MVKSRSSSTGNSNPSHKQDAKESEHARAHPLRRNGGIVDAWTDARKKQQQADEIIIERIEDWKETLNRLASSPDGQTFFKMMLKASNLFSPVAGKDTVQAVVDKQRQDFYLRHVRPYLDRSVRGEIE